MWFLHSAGEGASILDVWDSQDKSEISDIVPSLEPRHKI